jgi:N6-L-threonylcarbamoyladenine synthase
LDPAPRKPERSGIPGPDAGSGGLILGIETSCDENAAALLDEDGTVLSAVVRSQVDLHSRFGGVVPEIAGRSHVEHMLPVLEETFSRAGARPADLAAVAVTFAPGLIGSLLVGVSAAKALCLARGLPLIPVHHVEAHVYSCYQQVAEPCFPSACLVASGGHTSLFEVESPVRFRRVGETIDDAAGEAFDKVAALLGLGYPGGPVLDRLAREGNPERVRLPRPMLGPDSLDFSFSGLKTAVLYHCRGPRGRDPRPLDDQEVRDVAAAFQAAVVDVLTRKLLLLARRSGARSLAVGGGVAANGELRRRVAELAAAEGYELHLAPRELTGDNAVMVAGLGRLLRAAGVRAGLDLDAAASGEGTLPVARA